MNTHDGEPVANPDRVHIDDETQLSQTGRKVDEDQGDEAKDDPSQPPSPAVAEEVADGPID